MGLIQRYRGRISGPLMDRIDIHAEVERARKTQAARFAGWSKKKVIVYGDMGPAEVQKFCRL